MFSSHNAKVPLSFEAWECFEVWEWEERYGKRDAEAAGEHRGREERGWKVREHVAILAVGDRAGIAAGWRAVWPRIGMRGVLADKVPITQPFDEHSPEVMAAGGTVCQLP